MLVATTVVEVGVDVPAATIMVIENAERFGLAQLHQLRGRIGRGSEASTCLLLYKEPLDEMSTARLKVIRETTDGFRIAEEDLKLRGEGDVLGIRQSGLPGYRIARSEVHGQLITQARDEALRIMKDNPKLKGDARRGAALPALSVRARRGGAADRGGVSSLDVIAETLRSNQPRNRRMIVAASGSLRDALLAMTIEPHSTFAGCRLQRADSPPARRSPFRPAPRSSSAGRSRAAPRRRT